MHSVDHVNLRNLLLFIANHLKPQKYSECPKCHGLFPGSLGLRHLAVTDVNNRVVGVITRADLASKSIRSRIVAVYQPQDIFVVDPGPAALHTNIITTPRMRGLEQLLRRQALAKAHSELPKEYGSSGWSCLVDEAKAADPAPDGLGPAAGSDLWPPRPSDFEREAGHVLTLRSGAAIANGTLHNYGNCPLHPASHGCLDFWPGLNRRLSSETATSTARAELRAVQTWQTRLVQDLALRGQSASL